MWASFSGFVAQISTSVRGRKYVGISHLLDDGEKGNEGATEDTRTFKRLCVGRKEDVEKTVSTATGKGGVITFQNCSMHINNFNL